VNHKRFLVPAGKPLRLRDYDPTSTAPFESDEKALERARECDEALLRYGDYLLAHETHGVLVLFQGIDAAGKDGAIKNVLSSSDPQVCRAVMFKAPSKRELGHDYLWRYVKELPERGQIVVFNRSYYEQVTGERLESNDSFAERLPEKLQTKSLWKRRFDQINAFESYLVDNGFHILKFFLNVSKEKQRERLLERTERPEKMWKYSSNDLENRKRWSEVMKTYEAAMSATSTKQAPWYVIPADNRGVVHAIVGSILVEKLASLHSDYPKIDAATKREMAKARRELEEEGR
jgi:PPK2 family polyphosphate:nucleotide phosphotransferase